jgi:hypothetical protein
MEDIMREYRDPWNFSILGAISISLTGRIEALFQITK